MSSPRRILSLHLPRLAAERMLRALGPVSSPFAVVAETRGALRLTSLSAAAEAAGLAAGMALADARAIRPDLATRPAEPAADAAFLAALARWAGRWSPWAGLDGTDGLALDVTGCAHLFGGEAAMLADMTGRLAASGLAARAAIADTRGAAWALARFAAGTGEGPGAGRRLAGRRLAGRRLAGRAPGDAIAVDAPATRVRSPARRAITGAEAVAQPHPRETDRPDAPAPRSGAKPGEDAGAAAPSAVAERGARDDPASAAERAGARAQPRNGRERGSEAVGREGAKAREGADGADRPGPTPPEPPEEGVRAAAPPESATPTAAAPRGAARGARRGNDPDADAAWIVAPPGATRAALAPLPVSALRLSAEAADALGRVGLRSVGDLAGAPRGALARRFGAETVRRLDQALGAEPEPVAAAPAPRPCAARLSLPEPIGRVEDVMAGLDRLLARVAARLAERGLGARRLALALRRVDGSEAVAEIGLARPSRDAETIAELFARPVDEIDAGYGIEAMRLEATVVEPLAPRQHAGSLAARTEAAARARPGGGEGFARLLSRLGGRIGFERLERALPADSHIPAKAFQVASAAFADPPPGGWPLPARPRPLTLFAPEPLAPAGAERGSAAALRSSREDAPGSSAARREGGGAAARPDGQVAGAGSAADRAEESGGVDRRRAPDAAKERACAGRPLGDGRPLRVAEPEAAAAGRADAAPAPAERAARPPGVFRWRGVERRIAAAFGPERIAPEWWLDDPAWRSGPRDYWRVETEAGARLWLFHAPAAGPEAWFCEGEFA